MALVARNVLILVDILGVDHLFPYWSIIRRSENFSQELSAHYFEVIEGIVAS